MGVLSSLAIEETFVGGSASSRLSLSLCLSCARVL
jgi:hypothetical protein